LPELDLATATSRAHHSLESAGQSTQDNKCVLKVRNQIARVFQPDVESNQTLAI
jgi:hypothetical protein